MNGTEPIKTMIAIAVTSNVDILSLHQRQQDGVGAECSVATSCSTQPLAYSYCRSRKPSPRNAQIGPDQALLQPQLTLTDFTGWPPIPADTTERVPVEPFPPCVFISDMTPLTLPATLFTSTVVHVSISSVDSIIDGVPEVLHNSCRAKSLALGPWSAKRERGTAISRTWLSPSPSVKIVNR